MIPGHPRSSWSSRGVNMQSLTGGSLGLGVDHDVGNVRSLLPDALLDLARARVSLRKGTRRLQTESEVGEQSFVRVHEAQLARFLARDLAHDPQDDVALGRVVLDPHAFPDLGQRLDVC